MARFERFLGFLNSREAFLKIKRLLKDIFRVKEASV
jgi:hypothetical protein